jgi:hypothetical protein
MEKKASHSYKSHKVLGRLYDHVSRITFSPVLDGQFDERILQAYSYKELEPWMDLAEDIKIQYDTAIRRVMIQHEIGSEIEVVTGFVLAHSPEKNDYKYHEEIGTLFQGIKDTIRTTAQKEIDARVSGAGEEVSAMFVAAAYYVTAREIEDWREQEGLIMPQQEQNLPLEEEKPEEIKEDTGSNNDDDGKLSEKLESLDLETTSQPDSTLSESKGEIETKPTSNEIVETRSESPSERSSSISRIRSPPARRLSDSHTRISASKSPFVSFPWVFSDFLTRIAFGEFEGKEKNKTTQVVEVVEGDEDTVVG